MDGQRVQTAGMIDAVRVITTKKGDQMAFAQLEDLSGSIELVIFPRTFEDAREILAEDALVKVDAKVQVREDEPKLIADFIAPYQLPENARLRHPTRATAKHLTIEIALGRDERQTADIAERVYAVLAENHGDVPFSVYLTSHRGDVEIAFPDVATAYTPQLEQQIVSLVGRDRFRVDWK